MVKGAKGQKLKGAWSIEVDFERSRKQIPLLTEARKSTPDPQEHIGIPAHFKLQAFIPFLRAMSHKVSQFTAFDIIHWKFVVHEKNYLPDCTAGDDEGKSGYFQCAVHLPVDK